MNNKIITKIIVCPTCKGNKGILTTVLDELFEDDCPMCNNSGKIKKIYTEVESGKENVKIDTKETNNKEK
jgi:uncharacterized protein YbaR (Trm112 family)